MTYQIESIYVYRVLYSNIRLHVITKKTWNVLDNSMHIRPQKINKLKFLVTWITFSDYNEMKLITEGKQKSL